MNNIALYIFIGTLLMATSAIADETECDQPTKSAMSGKSVSQLETMYDNQKALRDGHITDVLKAEDGSNEEGDSLDKAKQKADCMKLIKEKIKKKKEKKAASTTIATGGR